MGGSDNAMLQHQENVARAAAYLVQIDRLEACDAHGIIFGGGHWDLEGDFYKRVMYDRNQGSEGPVPWAEDMEAREYTDLLKEAYDGHPGECCNHCAKHMAD